MSSVKRQTRKLPRTSTYIHTSRKPLSIEKLMNVNNPEPGKYNYHYWEFGRGFKPGGLWMARKDTWYNYAKEGLSNFNHRTNHIYEIKIKNDNLLLIDTYDKVIDLSHKYGYIKFEKFVGEGKSILPILHMNWDEIVKQYNGVIFNNFNRIDKKLSKYWLNWIIGLYGEVNHFDEFEGQIFYPKNVEKEIFIKSKIVSWYNMLDIDSVVIWRPSKNVISIKDITKEFKANKLSKT
jgi:hypothetical protein